uniref:Uncharacterized protein n=1 Tax=Rhizophora mucronata TaxID=61149 RepID=A0A2P2J0B8_RHIMU
MHSAIGYKKDPTVVETDFSDRIDTVKIILWWKYICLTWQGPLICSKHRLST